MQPRETLPDHFLRKRTLKKASASVDLFKEMLLHGSSRSALVLVGLLAVSLCRTLTPTGFRLDEEIKIPIKPHLLRVSLRCRIGEWLRLPGGRPLGLCFPSRKYSPRLIGTNLSRSSAKKNFWKSANGRKSAVLDFRLPQVSSATV